MNASAPVDLRKILLRLLAVSLPLFVLDQLTKWAIVNCLEEPISVIPGLFNLVFVRNTGAAFGMLKDQNLFFVIVSLGALGVISWMLFRGGFRDAWSQWGAILLIPGVFGNLTDRLVRRFVVDFLDFYIGEHHWPSFNVADSCICLAVCCFLIGAWREKPAEAKAAQ